MGIDTKEIILSGLVRLDKKSFVLVPLQVDPIAGYDRNPDPGKKEAVAGSIAGVQSVVVRSDGDLYYFTDNALNGLDFILNQWAVGMVYLLAGKACLNFPTTCAAHPSGMVQVARTVSRPFLNSHETMFPFGVDGGLWHSVVVPLLEDDRLSLTSPLNRNLDRNLDSFLNQIKILLRDRLQELNLIP